MVQITKVYTKTGDGGRTRLADMSEVSKTDPRVTAYGEVDSANAFVAVAATHPDCPADIAQLLRRIQNELFDAGADLSTPGYDPDNSDALRLTEAYVSRLEADCDAFNQRLPALRSFVVPGGSSLGAALHVARTEVRRAERAVWAADELSAQPGLSDTEFNPWVARYLNRLSDLLFILSRSVTVRSGEALWQPGGDRLAGEFTL